MPQEKDSRQYIKIRGANEHNLKNVDVDIPRDKLVVLTGHWHLIQFMRKDREDIWNHCLLTPDSSWDRWKNRM